MSNKSSNTELFIITGNSSFNSYSSSEITTVSYQACIVSDPDLYIYVYVSTLSRIFLCVEIGLPHTYCPAAPLFI